jgi:predicted transcriptional regulator
LALLTPWLRGGEKVSPSGSRLTVVAAFPAMMQGDRKREGLRVCRAAWLLGLSIREYREIEAGDREPSLDTYERISDLYGWLQTWR